MVKKRRRYNVSIEGGYIDNYGETEMKNVELKNVPSFHNRQTGKADLENVDTDSPIINDGIFKGKNLRIFLKRNWPWLTIILAILGIAFTIFFGIIK